MINRKTPPSAKEKISFEIPKIKLLKSQSGNSIYFVKKDKLPIVQLVVMFSIGSKFDPIDKKGLSYLTALMIDEGAGEYDALALNDEFEKLGTIFSISSNHDTFSFSLLSVKENFNRSFELLSKIINEPRFEDKDFMREKKKLLDKILQLKDEPSYIASSALERKIFTGSFYEFPEIGIDNTVSNITIEEIRFFYRERLRKSDMKIIAVGNIAESELLELISKYNFKTDTAISQTDNFQLKKSRTIFYYIDKKDSAQSEIRAGHISKPRNAVDFYSAKIMNTILGGQFSSRINLNLRERKGFTYGANSSFNYLQNAGYFEVSTAVNIQNTGEAITEILRELNSIRLNISREEIQFAKSYLIKQFPQHFETYVQIARNISPLIIHKLPIDYYEHYSTNIETTTEDEIIQAANENILPDQIIVLAVGDKKLIRPQLEMISNGNLYELDIYGSPVN